MNTVTLTPEAYKALLMDLGTCWMRNFGGMYDHIVDGLVA